MSHLTTFPDPATRLDDVLDTLAQGDRAGFDRLDPDTRDTFDQLREWAALGGLDEFEPMAMDPLPAHSNGTSPTRIERTPAMLTAAIPNARPAPAAAHRARWLWSAVAWLTIAAILAASVYGIVPRFQGESPNPTNPAFQPAASPQPAVGTDEINFAGDAGRSWVLDDDSPTVGDANRTSVSDKQILGSPLVVGDSMFFTEPIDFDMNRWHLVRYDLGAKERLWESDVMLYGAYASDGVRIYGFEPDGLDPVPVAVNIDTGDRAWAGPTLVGASDGIEHGPIVHNGTVYFTDALGNTVALDPATGAVRWQYPETFAEKTTFSDFDEAPSIVPDAGLVATDAGLFVDLPSRTIVKLDPATGEELDSVNLIDTFGVDIRSVSLQAIGDRLIVSVRRSGQAAEPSGELTNPVSFLAFDMASFELVGRSDMPRVIGNSVVTPGGIYVAGRADDTQGTHIYRVAVNGTAPEELDIDLGAEPLWVNLGLAGDTLMLLVRSISSYPYPQFAFFDIGTGTVIAEGEAVANDVSFSWQLWHLTPVVLLGIGELVQFGDGTPVAEASPEPAATPSPLIPASCLVTLPNGVDPANVEPPGQWVGKDGLYVGVPEDGIYLARTETGEQGGWNKHIWVRDADQGPLDVAVEPTGDDASGDVGRAEPDPGSPAMEIWFPEEGCWTITGTTPQTTISVTVWVEFVDSWLATPEPAATPAPVASPAATGDSDAINYGGGAGHPWYLGDDQPALANEPLTFTIDGERRDVVSLPLVVGNSMIPITTDATSDAANWQTIRYNLATGEVMWTSPVPLLGPFATDGTYVYGTALDPAGESGLYVPAVIRLDTGEMHMGVGEWLGSSNIPGGPVTVGTTGYFITADGVAAPVYPDGNLDQWVAREDWSSTNANQIDPGYVGGQSTTGIAAADDAIFVLRPSKTIVKIDRETGEELGSINAVDALRGDVSDVDIQVSGQRLVVTAYHANRPNGADTTPASILVYHTSNLSFIVRADVPDLRSNLAIDTNWIYLAGRLAGDEGIRIYRMHPSGGSLGTPISNFTFPGQESVGLSLAGSTLMVIGPPSAYAFIDVEQESVIQSGTMPLPDDESLMVFPIQLWGDVPVTVSDTGTVVVFGETTGEP